jgi:redox-sensitive bicupin YhaK (pirin superfamily)
MYNKIILDIKPLGFMWNTQDPFLFCVHHKDAYPAGTEKSGPAASLAGRLLGQDFTLKDGWRMYHGTEVPGFPVHPHRGFETVTAVLKGFVDHSDSHGAAGRYGPGDVQWMTAGAGLQHSEMFPLVNRDRDNPLDLFQIWLNLPAAAKFAAPHYKMLWTETVPVRVEKDPDGRDVSVRIIAGKIGDTQAPLPAPDSWAMKEEHEVGIWLITMDAHARWVLPAASPGVRRTLYFYDGSRVRLAGVDVAPAHSAALLADQEVLIENGTSPGALLLLQGRPIGEPVAAYGPFVMNTPEEITRAIEDYRSTGFGGWPWPSGENIHPRARGRFARYADGRQEIRE